MKKETADSNPILEYHAKIETGEIMVGKKIWKTYNHLADELNSSDSEYYYDPIRAQHIITFFHQYLRHSKGKWGGKKINLELWQRALYAALYGFVDIEGVRQYRRCVLIVGKKNGKSFMSSGTGLYGLTADGEAGAEIYSVAPLSLDTEIMTNKEMKTMGSISVGDYVFTPTGKQTMVNYVSPIVTTDSYTIEFDDGSSVISTGNHPWEVEQLSSGGAKKSLVWKKKNVTTENIILTYNKRKATRIRCAESPEISEKVLSIMPYTLGAWLGDGRSNRGCICGHIDDIELRTAIEQDGYNISYMKQQLNTVYFTVLGLRTKLRENNLLENKHIPEEYFFSSTHQRMELLRGLMDTDGTCTKTGECRYAGNCKQLCTDVNRLALSLGYKSHIHTSKDQNGKIIYLVSFKAYQAKGNIFKLSRKASRQKQSECVKANYRFIINIKKINTVPCRCIGVEDSSHLFCFGKELIATHNTKKDQAKIIWDEAKRMRNKSPALTTRIRATVSGLYYDKADGLFKPLAADVNTLDGLNVYYALMDEFQQWRNGRALYDIIADGISAREQPLIFMTSTAGTVREDIYDEIYEECNNIINGYGDPIGYKDERTLPVIYELDKREEWEEEKCWLKANPNLGVSKSADYLKEKVELAKKNKNLVKNLLCKEFNIRETSSEAWLTFEQCVNETVVDIEYLKGSYAIGGCDLSATTDLTCATLLIKKPNDTNFYVLQQYFLPRCRIEEVEANSKKEAPYLLWAEQGWLTICEGATVDYHQVTEWFNRMVSDNDIRPLWINFDRALSGYWVPEMKEYGFEMVDTPQGARTWNYPMKRLGGLLEEHRIIYQNNPMLRWCLLNTKKKSLNENGIESIQPVKEKSTKRIDGMVSLLNAFVGYCDKEDEYSGYIR